MLVWACIAPHGGELISELAGDNLARMVKTRTGMEALGRNCRDAMPDTIVVMTPHGMYDESSITIGESQTAFGELEDCGGRVEALFQMDQHLTQGLIRACNEQSFPITVVTSNDEEGNSAPFPLDWGAFIPLWFMGAQWENRPEIVVLCASRDITRTELVRFGTILANVMEAENRRFAFICSADLGHGHLADGPYGFTPVSAEFDDTYCLAVRDNNLESLLRWDEDWIGKALTDAYWQSLVLLGLTRVCPMKSNFISYEAPTYFGMMTAEYFRE